MESATVSKLNTRKKKSQTHPPLTLKNKPSMVDTLMAALEHREVTGRRHSMSMCRMCYLSTHRHMGRRTIHGTSHGLAFFQLF